MQVCSPHVERDRGKHPLGDDELAPQSRLLCGVVYPPILEKMSRKGAPPQAEVTKSL